VTEEGKD